MLEIGHVEAGLPRPKEGTACYRKRHNGGLAGPESRQCDTVQDRLKLRRARIDTLAKAFRNNLRLFIAAALLSGVINVLALTGSLYMLEIYDRVLPSRSLSILATLTVAMIGLYAVSGLLEWYRMRLLSRAGARIDSELAEHVFPAAQRLALRGSPQRDRLQPLRSLDHIRTFLSGRALTALFDLPWLPIYLGVIFLLHPLLGLFATLSAMLLVCLAVLAELRCASPTKTATDSGAKRWATGAAVLSSAETTRAMGFGPRLFRRWTALNAAHLNDQLIASAAANRVGSAARTIRSIVQSGIVGLGAFLVIWDQGSIGVIVAASILLSRALAPVETTITHWRSISLARQSYVRLAILLYTAQSRAEIRPGLAKPHLSLSVEHLSVTPPGAAHPVVHDIGFALKAGDGLGIIGPSASGKSTLVRALAGAWSAVSTKGCVRLDDMMIERWLPDTLGQHVGYMAQDIQFFEGTVAENISRFDPAAAPQDTLRAARAAEAHDMIAQLPQGYQTQVGGHGTVLSAGQRQRLALARALYHDPFLVVLDEPNANLDHCGSVALQNAIASVRKRGGIAIVVAHRGGALAAIDQVLVMANGRAQTFGPKEKVLPRVLRPVARSLRRARAGGLGPVPAPEHHDVLGQA